ncbi:hypothetical protein AB9F29_08760 [Falsihalocynthiibacter sp. S25ZX9]|uniref:hypothetical protein n=1 Tax=Falsihalocynthiibacter sp. S25ZX9 TaxID=3240870 RepID=UPI00350EF700
MIKVVLGAVLGAAIVVAGYFLLNKPEPTSEQRLKSALEDAGDAAKDVVGDVGTSIAKGASDKAEGMARYVEQLSDDAKVKLEIELAKWRESGTISDDSFDFEKAVADLKNSDLSTATQAQINDILKTLQDAPESFDAQLNELRKQLEK